MYRVINQDLSYIEKEVMAKCDTFEEAETIQLQESTFMTTVEKWVNGKWIEVKSIHEKMSKELSKHFPLH